MQTQTRTHKNVQTGRTTFDVGRGKHVKRSGIRHMQSLVKKKKKAEQSEVQPETTK